MYELNRIVASSAKKINENAGVVATSVAKSVLSSGKNEFLVKTKVAFSDLKNMNATHNQKASCTPSKSIKKEPPKGKHSSDKPNETESAPTLMSNNFEVVVNPIEDTVQSWNDQLMLTDEQFALLFLQPNENNAPPTPEPIPEFPDYLDIIDCESRFEFESDSIDDELPSLNLSFIDVSWQEESKENNRNISNYYF